MGTRDLLLNAMPQNFADTSAVMRWALELAAGGIGLVEPNPPVGAVVVDDELRFVGEGFHERFGGRHAEVNALEACGDLARGATLFVTLEPCCHYGKTPPCTERVISAGIRRVVVATADPAVHVDGSGIGRLREAGVEVEVGLLSEEAELLIAPFRRLTTSGRPYVHAKWAMTLDGRMGTQRGDSKWISSEESRRIAHTLRGRMDAVIVGIGTVLADDPLLTARPPGPRTAVRVVLDSLGRTPVDSRLVRSLNEGPILIVVNEAASPDRCKRLSAAGVEIIRVRTRDCGGLRIDDVMLELGRREMTNVLVEGGGRVLGGFFEEELIDVCHVFVAAMLVGGCENPVPLTGAGREWISQAACLRNVSVTTSGGDVYLCGLVDRSSGTSHDSHEESGEPVRDEERDGGPDGDPGETLAERES